MCVHSDKDIFKNSAASNVISVVSYICITDFPGHLGSAQQAVNTTCHILLSEVDMAS